MLPAFLVFTHQAISYPAVCHLLLRCTYTDSSHSRRGRNAVCYPHSRCTYILRVVSVVRDDAVCYPHFVCTYTMVYVTLTFCCMSPYFVICIHHADCNLQTINDLGNLLSGKNPSTQGGTAHPNIVYLFLVHNFISRLIQLIYVLIFLILKFVGLQL